MRLNKFIAQCTIPDAGKLSRRRADKVISEGRVKVNGKVIDSLGFMIEPDKDHVRVDGYLLKPEKEHTHLILNKPKKFIVTKDDPKNRPTVFELIGKNSRKVQAIGRLDYNSEGLLLLSSDGELVNRLTHPRYKVKKVYNVKIWGTLTEKQEIRFRRGLVIDGKRTQGAELKFMRSTGKNAWYQVTLQEGRKRQIRRMFEALNRQVLKLKRISYGPITLKGLPPGHCRKLTKEEVKSLYSIVGKKNYPSSEN